MQEKISKIDMAERGAIITFTVSHRTTFITPTSSSVRGLQFDAFQHNSVPQNEGNR